MKKNHSCNFEKGKFQTPKQKLSIILSVSFLFLSSITFAQTQLQKAKIIQQSNYSALMELQQNIEQEETAQKAEAIQAAQNNNWEVQKTLSDGSFAELQRLDADGNPIYYRTFNVAAAKSTRTNHLNSGGSLGLNLNGQNMTAHVWDAGHARLSHQEYDGPGGNNRVSIGDAGSESLGVNDHAAHVTGTIVASGVQADAKGMAPQAKAVGYGWNSDTSEATAAAANGMIVSNHSYGFLANSVRDQLFGAYIDESRRWDQIMFNAPFYLMVVAAGNDGNNNTANAVPLDGNSSYDKLTGHSTSKNNLVVANARDANIANDGTLNSVTINSSSSEGPTDDYRIKPDITGNGTSVRSTLHRNDSDYASYTGTSMASPNVAGTLLLLQQHYNNINNNLMRAATLKGIALHTADDIGPSGPDAVHGWGLLNAKAAAEAITNNGSSSKVEELTLNNGQTYTITVESDGNSPLLASISWTDRPGSAVSATNSKTPVLVNDLDIRVTKGSSTFSPFKLTSITTNSTGDNNVDPYERVDVANASGTYTITITHKGSLVGGSQNFSLILTGIKESTSNCTASVPANVASSNVNTSSATIGWDTVSGATYDLRYRQTGTNNWTTVSANTNSRAITGLTASTAYEAQVRSKCPDGTNSNYSTSVNFTTTTSQISYCTASGNNASEEYISRVQLGSIDNSSSLGSGYTDHTAISTNLSKGVSNTITITPTWTGTTYNEAYSVWIDYNQNGDFDDTGEQVWTQDRTQNTPVSGSFTVPETATNGATRMRVIMRYNAAPSACGTFNYGEVEDYTVNIQSGGNSNDICEGVTAWSSSQTYQVGDKVTYQGNLYEKTADSWTNLGACGTSANTLFAKQSTNQLSNIGRFSIYPNPVTNGILNIETNTLEIKNYSIINTLGQVIQKGTFTNSIDLQELKAGHYILKTQHQAEHFIVN
ncbi:S8 family serine peptidase [Aquimarina sp. 2201CG1-2-11]|uniref:S8 family serine peptidase n=1 Tax=Aquimarina discodermiae TaxID=3231043 RepID=UPI003462851E